jgi:hypothetical protein
MDGVDSITQRTKSRTTERFRAAHRGVCVPQYLFIRCRSNACQIVLHLSPSLGINNDAPLVTLVVPSIQ